MNLVLCTRLMTPLTTPDGRPNKLQGLRVTAHHMHSLVGFEREALRIQPIRLPKRSHAAVLEVCEGAGSPLRVPTNEPANSPANERTNA